MSLEHLPHEPKQVEMRVFAEILPHIESGEKRYEIRVRRPHHDRVEVGDTITFNCSVSRRVVGKEYFSSPRELLATHAPDDILPGKSEEDLLKLWQTRIDPDGDCEKLGIIAFELG